MNNLCPKQVIAEISSAQSVLSRSEGSSLSKEDSGWIDIHNQLIGRPVHTNVHRVKHFSDVVSFLVGETEVFKRSGITDWNCSGLVVEDESYATIWEDWSRPDLN